MLLIYQNATMRVCGARGAHICETPLFPYHVLCGVVYDFQIYPEQSHGTTYFLKQKSNKMNMAESIM